MQEYGKNPFGGNDSFELQSSKGPQFFDEVDSLKRLLVQYDDGVETVEGLQRRSLAETRTEELEAIQRDIDKASSRLRGLAGELRTRIKSLEAQSMRDETRYAQTENLRRQFLTLIQKYQSVEAAFRQRYRDIAARQYRIVDPLATDEQVQEAIDDEQGGQVFSQALMQSNRRGEARAALSEVQARHREIQKIEATITDLAQLFHDMEIMVAEQDEQVGNVETNVFSAEQDVERGLDNQFEAVRKAKSLRRMKWGCAITLIIIVIVLALVLGIYFGTHN